MKFRRDLTEDGILGEVPGQSLSRPIGLSPQAPKLPGRVLRGRGVETRLILLEKG